MRIYGSLKLVSLLHSIENETSFSIVARLYNKQNARSHYDFRAKAVNLIKLAAGIKCRCHVQINEQYGYDMKRNKTKRERERESEMERERECMQWERS